MKKELSILQFNQVTDREFMLQMLLAECVRRLSKNGKHKMSITNAQLGRLVEGEFEVDFSESNEDRFILKFQKMSEEDIFVKANVVVPLEKMVGKNEKLPSE
jgi:hypothetical protein